MEKQDHYRMIERYQALYEKNRRSKIFASLAESYIKVGMLEPALEISHRGVKMHPHFPNGHMALAKVYLALQNMDNAIFELKKVIELSPENILAHKLLAKTFLKKGQNKLALRSFKMVLFLSPENSEVIQQVRTLEKSISDENNDSFEMKFLEKLVDTSKDSATSSPPQAQQKQPLSHKKECPVFLERTLSLADAYIKRNDIQWALKTLEEAENSLGPHPELTKRIRFLSARSYSNLPDFIEDSPHSVPTDVLKKVAFLKELLARIDRNSATTHKIDL